MKHCITHIVFLLIMAFEANAQTIISGVVSDSYGPLVGANVFVFGTLDGCLTDTLGRFSFSTNKGGVVTLKASFVGYDEFTLTDDVTSLHELNILMTQRATPIDEVVVVAGTYCFSKDGNLKSMDALDVVMAGNSCGDIVAALHTLPGTQMVGESGRLYVRGGNSDECQTFVNGMHVLVPYSTNTANSAVRGRFSPFMFKGVNFSLGGYNGEYGQALSAVLPMETTDVSLSDKFGVSASMVDWNIGGTKAFADNSLSFNLALTDMGLYDKMFSHRFRFFRPYRKLSGETQYKADFGNKGVVKTYFGYDLTSVGQIVDGRRLSLAEHNLYANATFKQMLTTGCMLFAGFATSAVSNDIDNARVDGDHYRNRRREIHLKSGLQRVFSDLFKMSVGAECYFRNSSLAYDDYAYHLDYNLLAAHADAQCRLTRHLFLGLSARAELMKTRHWLLMPRATITYIPAERFQISLQAGNYSQAIGDDYLAQGHSNMAQSRATHGVVSGQYSTDHLLIRVEAYSKKYSHLPLFVNGLFDDAGHGSSRGADLFVEGRTLCDHLTATFSYSLNDTRRFELDYPSAIVPDYASRHNLRFTARYAIGKAILGVAESFASQRRFPSATAPCYNSLDANFTFLVGPRVIVYSSLSNILGRKNINGYQADGAAIHPSHDRFLYIGIFVSLKNNKAYDISNF